MITTGRRFSPSVNLTRDLGSDLAYVATANAQRAYFQILNDFSIGIHSFSLIGSYGTGKSSFLVALEQTLNHTSAFFPKPNGHFGGANRFEFLNIVGSYTSLTETLANALGASSQEGIWQGLNSRCSDLQKINGFLLIVIDEFGKFLEFAARENPERELYFIQQLAEFVNDQGKNAALLVTLHQNFSAYAHGLDGKQREEWEKVKGRLKELTFNEPVEQLLELAANQMNGTADNFQVEGLEHLVDVIDDSRAFPHRRKLQPEFANRLLPFDLLAASILTQALQRYGQNERSLFTFLNANDTFGLKDFDRHSDRYFNLACVYDYLSHNYDSLLTSVHNPHYTQWGAIRSALERAEADIPDQVNDARRLLKVIGLLNIFAPQGAKIDEPFVCNYARLALGMANVESLLEILEARKIIRFVRFKETFVLFEGTDLNIELALLEAGSVVEPVDDVVPLLRKHFVFPIVPAKAISYQTGTPRFFGYQLSLDPIVAPNQEPIFDGIVNLIFSETLALDGLLATSRSQSSLVLYCWYRSTRKIRDLLYEIAKIDHVIAVNESDKVAVRELQNLRNHQIEILNQNVLHSIYAGNNDVVWVWHGEMQSISDPAELNAMLSEICREVFSANPVFRNELVNKNVVSSAVATARKAYFGALVARWAETDLGFSQDKYPPEKTIYLSLLRNTGIHRLADNQWTLDEPNDPGFAVLWYHCEAFLERARSAPKNVADLFDSLRQTPFGLKQGFIDFWVPTFLFARREAFALYREDRFQPELTAETLELIRLTPLKYQIKSFSVDGIRLRFFNRCRALIQSKEVDRITRDGFMETVKPFIVFYNGLSPYAKQTQRLATPTLRLRAAIANAKDPERTFFEEFPRALGFPDIADELVSDAELEAYIHQLQTSVQELQSCYDDLIDRIENHLLDIMGLTGEQFPNYKSAIANRFATLRTYLLLPKQRTLHIRLASPLEDRAAWLGAVVQCVLGRDMKQMSDEDELVVFARLREVIQELDNLCELDTLAVDPQRESGAMRVEITALGEESHKLLHRLPKQKENAVAVLQGKLKEIFTDDESVNVAALIRLLQEMIASE